MSKRFLTPVNLPSGVNLPSVGSIGDLFFKTTDQKVYTYTNLGWAAPNEGVSSLSQLTDVTAATPATGEVLFYDGSVDSWINTSFLELLVSFGVLTGDGGAYNTTEFAGTIDGGLYNTTEFIND